ncbi:hypothetical protein PFJ87_07g01190 [Encephalitozoon hellem]|uniref:Uncharacterized protein n=1 Tax=Encephalitozoon hellem TaxID=27973 RepID=A0ABY8CLM2_ENCHE|nr:hypothetical protein PFJ87_07g01190 [Encephalitozoon hellem]
MDRILQKLLFDTRFTTNKIEKEFLVRRMGLGYSMRPKKLERDIIRPCLKAARKREEANVAEEEEEDVGRSGSVKKRSVSRRH